MFKKRDNLKLKVFIYFSILLLVGALFFFRSSVINFTTKKYISVFNILSSAKELELNNSEREQLEILKLENKTLNDELKKLKEDISIGEEDVKPSLIKMLGKELDLYGNFYTTYPKDKSVYKNMNVFAAGNIVIGQVDEIYDSSLKISRLGQNKSFIADVLESEETVELSSLGNGLYFGKLTGGSKISEGDTLVMKGYPKAIVGNVVEINHNDTSLTTILVRTPYNITNKDIFYVLQ